MVFCLFGAKPLSEKKNKDQFIQFQSISASTMTSSFHITGQ